MTDKEIRKWLDENGYEDTQFLIEYNYYSAIIGVSYDGKVIYDYDRMVEYLIREQDMTLEEAIDWIDFNTLRFIDLLPNKVKPIVLFSLN